MKPERIFKADSGHRFALMPYARYLQLLKAERQMEAYKEQLQKETSGAGRA